MSRQPVEPESVIRNVELLEASSLNSYKLLLLLLITDHTKRYT